MSLFLQFRYYCVSSDLVRNVLKENFITDILNPLDVFKYCISFKGT